ncbi:hypothetical protein GCK72_007076 [Caenorhabditis remanei]|uniref:Serpentine receptor class gamma n=1 Tax=Caenorhabditis remanei TaxID=31234 RepID=A0A6A5HH15_CAERE|nr:hypothetical protein GCK72_007076 [Caenorhabditis remanei]KAF1767118.1 hypothetical protein GCK72_007076 [Caenorhabditis remanei]
MWMKRMKWLMVLIFVTPAATDWNLVISRVYMQPLFGGFASEYTRKVPWAKQSRFQLFFISVALFFTITCYSYTLHSLITLPNRIITAEKTLTIATAYVSIGYVVLAGMQFFFAFFPYLLSDAFYAISTLAYDFLNVGSPVIMIMVTESLRHHVFRSKSATQQNQNSGDHVFLVGVMIVVNHSKTCKFIIQSLLVLNRMTCVMYPTSHIKMWMKRMKWLMVLIFVTPAATDWNLVISRVYMQPLFGGFASEYTRKVPWAKQSRFQLFFISVALFFTITCYSYTLHSLITLPHRIITAERTLTIATAYVSIGYVVLAGMQFFFAFFPYLLSDAFYAISTLAYDFLNVGSPVIMIVVTESLRHHVFRSKPAEQENQSHVFTVIKSRSVS